MTGPERIAVVGLGYVGLPLAVALARRFDTVGFDINPQRIAELQRGHDRTGEVEDRDLTESGLALSAAAPDIAGRDIYIVTVPTPVDAENQPDLAAVRSACRLVGEQMRSGATVVFESTVYPGVTEEVCGPELAAHSGLQPGRDFFLGYSPERINPGDREHTVERITKVVAGETPAVAERLARVYGAVTTGGVFVARDIGTAEAAKVIENAQRDINIAFINEVAMIAQRLGLSVHDVLEAARTKWNFLPFTPGLVGGHCIGVDPYYLAHRAREVGHEPAIILAGRRLNDAMAAHIAQMIDSRLERDARLLVLGLTFKENVPDLRNSKVADLVHALAACGHQVSVHDALADVEEARALYGVPLIGPLGELSGFDAIVGVVPHAPYLALQDADFRRLLKPGGLVADVKGLWRGRPLPEGLQRWQL